MTSTTGKRIAPSLPKAVGPWLCGLYDNDKSVSRAAQDGLALSFPTEEKRDVIWEVYKDALLGYADDAILVQTSATLSDERATSKDDAESKYARVVGSAIYMLGHLIRHTWKEKKPAPAAFTKHLSEVLAHRKLWEFVHDSDPYLRRSTCSLATFCVEMDIDLHWTAVSTAFLSKGLQASQLGSNGQFSGALLALTKARPEIWTTDHHGRTHPSKRLLQFLTRGSQRGTEDVWTNFQSLFHLVPSQILAGTEADFSLSDASAVTNALREGVTNAEEPRQNLTAAWRCYFELCFFVQSRLLAATDRERLFQDHVAPVIFQYVDPDPKVSYIPPVSILPAIANAVLRPIYDALTEAFHKLWSDLGNLLEDKMKLSLPETSKDFALSQEGIVKVSDRLFKIEKNVLDTLTPGRSQYRTSFPAVMHGLSTIDQFNQRIVAAAVSILKNRKGKPYGAAAVLHDVASTSNTKGAGNELLNSFLQNDAPQLMESPSAVRLVKLTASLGLPLGPLMQPLINAAELDAYGVKAFAAMLNTVSQAEAASFPEIGLLVVSTLNGESSDDSSILFSSSALRNPNLRSSGLVKELTQTVLDYLSPVCATPKQRGALVLLEAALTDPTSAAIFTADEHRLQLLSKLLILCDNDDHQISSLAAKIVAKIKMTSGQDVNGSSAAAAFVGEQLAGSQSQLPILSLVDLAIEELQQTTEKDNNLSSLLPTDAAWLAALKPHLRGKPPPTLSITSPLQGAIHLLRGRSNEIQQGPHDSEGLSEAFRLTLYVVRLLSSHKNQKKNLPASSNLIFHLAIALQLINEKLTLESANTVWIEGTGEVLDEAADVLSHGNSIFQAWIIAAPTAFLEAVQQLWDNVSASHPAAYYHALALCNISAYTTDHDGLKQMFPDLEADVRELHRSDDLLRSATLANCAREHVISSSVGRRTLNEILSDATQVKWSNPVEGLLRPIVLLNIMLNGDSDPLEGIQSQRLVFLMQNLVRLLEAGSGQTEICSEILKLLCAILPAVQEIYGEHWQTIFNEIVKIWGQADDHLADLALLHSSLRLYQRLKGLARADDVNEDLAEAWKGTIRSIDTSLLQCLPSFVKAADGVNQPRQITAELLARLIGDVEIQPEEISSTVSLLSAQDVAVVGAAYGLLHRAIPKRQEDLSMILALEKQVIHLPEELLSLIAEIPSTSETYLALFFLKRCFLSWKLVFDHFTTASYKLREAYVADLRDTGCIALLLDSICDIMGVAGARPLDVTRVDFEEYELGTAEPEEKEMQRLGVHLYYCALLYIPGLVKAWYIEQKNRIRSPLESWTKKYISHPVSTASLETVSEWAKTQDLDDNPVQVKFNASIKELVASMAIDPESPPIAIVVQLPQSFPLESPRVTGRTRVGVSEKNWQAWMRTFQIIIFSTGSIIEGLIAFRRNTTLALKGQGECAICYSIIGTDMQTPNKKCGTCKNTFHGSCLFRWFSSSNSSTCPLCRNNFSYA